MGGLVMVDTCSGYVECNEVCSGNTWVSSRVVLAERGFVDKTKDKRSKSEFTKLVEESTAKLKSMGECSDILQVLCRRLCKCMWNGFYEDGKCSYCGAKWKGVYERNIMSKDTIQLIPLIEKTLWHRRGDATTDKDAKQSRSTLMHHLGVQLGNTDVLKQDREILAMLLELNCTMYELEGICLPVGAWGPRDKYDVSLCRERRTIACRERRIIASYKCMRPNGVAYRDSKDMNNRDLSKDGPKYGAIADAISVEDGWIQTRYGFLPITHNGDVYFEEVTRRRLLSAADMIGEGSQRVPRVLAQLMDVINSAEEAHTRGSAGD